MKPISRTIDHIFLALASARWHSRSSLPPLSRRLELKAWNDRGLGPLSTQPCQLAGLAPRAQDRPSWTMILELKPWIQCTSTEARGAQDLCIETSQLNNTSHSTWPRSKSLGAMGDKPQPTLSLGARGGRPPRGAMECRWGLNTSRWKSSMLDLRGRPAIATGPDTHACWLLPPRSLTVKPAGHWKSGHQPFIHCQPHNYA